RGGAHLRRGKGRLAVLPAGRLDGPRRVGLPRRPLRPLPPGLRPDGRGGHPDGAAAHRPFRPPRRRAPGAPEPPAVLPRRVRPLRGPLARRLRLHGIAYLTPHAYGRFRARVADVSHAEAVRAVEVALRRPRRVVEPDRSAERLYAARYRGRPLYLTPGPGDGDDPSGVRSYGQASVRHGCVIPFETKQCNRYLQCPTHPLYP